MNYVRLVFCLPDLHACTLVYEIKTNASRLYTVEIRSVLLNYVGKVFLTFLSFIILLCLCLSYPCLCLQIVTNFIKSFGLVLVVFDSGGL